MSLRDCFFSPKDIHNFLHLGKELSFIAFSLGSEIIVEELIPAL